MHGGSGVIRTFPTPRSPPCFAPCAISISTGPRPAADRMAQVAAISHADAADPVAYIRAQPVTAARFLADVERVAEKLPARPHLVNLCMDRYRFAVGLIAALVRGQVSLLPPNQTPEMLRQLQQDYGDLYALIDSAQDLGAIRQVAYPQAADGSTQRFAPGEFSVPAFAGEQIA